MELIKREPAKRGNKKLNKDANIYDKEEIDDGDGSEENVNVMNLDDESEINSENGDDDDEDSDLSGDGDGSGRRERGRIVLDGKCLENIDSSEIFVIDYTKYCKDMVPKYFRCIVPEQCYQIIQCPNCQLLFQRDEYEVALINNGHLCPFCRFKFAD